MDAKYLSSIKQQDMEAFRSLVTEYGKGLYVSLYSVSGNEEIARKATKEAFIELYMALNSRQGPDVTESLLFSIGERKQKEMLREQTADITESCLKELQLPEEKHGVRECAQLPVQKELKAETARDVQTEQIAVGDAAVVVEPQQKAKENNAFWQIMLVLVIALILWTAGGMLMKSGHLPMYDLGYSWFDKNIALIFGLQ